MESHKIAIFSLSLCSAFQVIDQHSLQKDTVEDVIKALLGSIHMLPDRAVAFLPSMPKFLYLIKEKGYQNGWED